MNFKKYKGTKSLEVIQAQCVAQGLVLNRQRYDEGDDFVTVHSPQAPGAVVFFNTFNGRFFGTTHTGLEFRSDQELDELPWFSALLDFFMEPLETPAIGEQLKSLGLDSVPDVAAFKSLVEVVADTLGSPSPLNLGELAFETEAAAGTQAVPYDGYTTKLHKCIS